MCQNWNKPSSPHHPPSHRVQPGWKEQGQHFPQIHLLPVSPSFPAPIPEGNRTFIKYPKVASIRTELHLQSMVQPNGEKNPPTLPARFSGLSKLPGAPFPLSIPEELGFHGVGAVGLLLCQAAAEGAPAPSGISRDFSLRPARVGINPTGVICMTAALGSAPFVPENGILRVNSSRGIYQTSTALHGPRCQGTVPPNRGCWALSQLRVTAVNTCDTLAYNTLVSITGTGTLPW